MISRQLQRIRDRRAKGLCGRCPRQADVNPVTGKAYELCAACRMKKNGTQAKGAA